MTEDTLDILRKYAAVIDDEGARLVRSLKGSSAVEATVREHLGNVEAAAKKCRDVLDPTVVTVPFVQVDPVKQPEVTVTVTPSFTLPTVPPNRVIREGDILPRKGKGK